MGFSSRSDFSRRYQQRFHEQLDSSRWSANQMDYVDGASSAVLRNPYTLAFDPYDESLFVASFTLNHIVKALKQQRGEGQDGHAREREDGAVAGGGEA